MGGGRLFPAILTGRQADTDFSCSLNRCGHTIQLPNELVLTLLHMAHDLLPNARRDLMDIGTSLRKRIFSKVGCPIEPGDAFQANVGRVIVCGGIN